MGCVGVVRDRRRMGDTFFMNWFVVVIRKIVQDIPRVIYWWERFGMRMVFNVIRHLRFICCGNIIMRSWGYV